MTNLSINRLVERFFAHLFFFFFVFEIFSPQIGGRTLYIEYVFVLLNPYFWHWLFRIRFSPHVLYCMVPAIVLVPFHTFSAVKLVVVFFGVAFLVYAHERRLFHAIKPYLFISLFFAVLQFVGSIIGSSWSETIGPTSLAGMVWGAHATPTNTNFYTIFFFPRVSGLSREAGFFASLLIVSYFALLINSRLDGRRLSRKMSLSFVVGYVVSFSKGSFALLPGLLLIKFRRLVDRIPLFLIGGAFLGGLVLFWHHFQIFLVIANSITYLARFAGYALLYDLNVHQLIFGVSDLTKISSPFAQLVVQEQALKPGSSTLAGLGAWCLQNGILAFFLYTLGLQALGIRGAGFLLVLLMTATVGIDTNQNFVLLTYYVAFMLPKLNELYAESGWRRAPRLIFQKPKLIPGV